jgi:hypothetical protein
LINLARTRLFATVFPGNSCSSPRVHSWLPNQHWFIHMINYVNAWGRIKHLSYYLSEHYSNTIYRNLHINTKALFLFLMFWRLFRGQTSTSISTNAPYSTSTWCCYYRACPGFATREFLIRNMTSIGFSMLHIHLIHLIRWVSVGDVRHGWSLNISWWIYSWKATCSRRRTGIGQWIFLHNVCYPRQYAECQVSKNPWICFQDCMSHVLQN